MSGVEKKEKLRWKSLSQRRKKHVWGREKGEIKTEISILEAEKACLG